MATTPTYGWPYQSLSDRPDGPALGHDLALAIEATVAALAASVAALHMSLLIASNYKTTGDSTVAAGASAITHSLSFTAVSGTVYTADWWGAISGTVAASAALLTFVHASGGSVTTGSTQMSGGYLGYTVNANNHLTPGISMTREFTASASGTYTIGVYINFFSGSGNMTVYANANQTSVLKVRRTVT